MNINRWVLKVAKHGCCQVSDWIRTGNEHPKILINFSEKNPSGTSICGSFKRMSWGAIKQVVSRCCSHLNIPRRNSFMKIVSGWLFLIVGNFLNNNFSYLILLISLLISISPFSFWYFSFSLKQKQRKMSKQKFHEWNWALLLSMWFWWPLWVCVWVWNEMLVYCFKGFVLESCYSFLHKNLFIHQCVSRSRQTRILGKTPWIWEEKGCTFIRNLFQIVDLGVFPINYCVVPCHFSTIILKTFLMNF